MSIINLATRKAFTDKEIKSIIPEIISSSKPELFKPRILNQNEIVSFSIRPDDKPETIIAGFTELMRRNPENFHSTPMGDGITDGKSFTLWRKTNHNGETAWTYNYNGQQGTIDSTNLGALESHNLWYSVRSIQDRKPTNTGFISNQEMAMTLGNLELGAEIKHLRKGINIITDPNRVISKTNTAARMFMDREPLALQLKPSNIIRTRIFEQNGSPARRKETLEGEIGLLKKVERDIRGLLLQVEEGLNHPAPGGTNKSPKLNRENLTKNGKGIRLPDGSSLFIGIEKGQPVIGIKKVLTQKSQIIIPAGAKGEKEILNEKWEPVKVHRPEQPKSKPPVKQNGLKSTLVAEGNIVHHGKAITKSPQGKPHTEIITISTSDGGIFTKLADDLKWQLKRAANTPPPIPSAQRLAEKRWGGLTVHNN